LGRSSLLSLFTIATDPSPLTRLRDAARASEIAQSHLAQVRAAHAKAVVEGVENPAARALLDTEYRVRTIAATETFQAANEERIAVAEDVQRETGALLLQEWNAEFDACPVCKDVDGETVQVGESFSLGIPGAAHPGCRCWVEIYTATGRKVA
jgi:hypothetical protein